jgi:transcriptional regulator with XRE-family HTH domain
MPDCGKLASMPGKPTGVGGHFGRQMRKERLAHGWSLPELSQRTGYDAGHLSRVENGKRPPTEALAAACDAVFAERRGWFTDWYQESRSWSEVPAGFRSWSELEDKAARLCDWMPGTVTGLLQSEDYARSILATFPAVTEDTIATRLASRVERQGRVLARDDPPKAIFLVDELALYRQVGTADVMAGQMRQLAATAAMPHVTVQVLPAVAHPANASGFVIADDAVWCEHVAGGYVFTDAQTVSALSTRFDTLRGESYRVSESLTLIKGMAELWTAGVSPLTQTRTAASA